jgi:hypothetical protein
MPQETGESPMEDETKQRCRELPLWRSSVVFLGIASHVWNDSEGAF